jgi:hypothetical protein
VSFLNLWWAAGTAALVIPALVLLYFLKLRRREQPVSSTLLWTRAVQDLRANVPFQRLRRNILLLLQLLILALIIFALARPVLESTAGIEGRLVILIDRSASMNTWEGEQTRLELAKDQVIGLLKSLNRGSGGWQSLLRFGGGPSASAMIIAFADRAAIVSPFTPNSSELIEAVRQLEPTDGTTNLREALELAQAYARASGPHSDQAPARPAAPARLILFSDGALVWPAEVNLLSSQLELVSVGSTCDNAAITTMRAQRDYEEPDLVRVFVQVENFSDKPVRTTLALYVDGVLAETPVRELVLGPAARAQPQGAEPQFPAISSLSFELTLPRSGVLEARLSRPDALLADNRAWAVVPAPRKLRVLVVTRSNFLLDSVLAGLPLEERAFLTPQQFESKVRGSSDLGGYGQYDVVIFDKYQPEEILGGNFIFLAAAPPLDGFGASGRVEQVEPLIWWDETHPILRHVGLDDVLIADSLVLTLPAEALVLAEGTHGPAVVLHRREGRQCLVTSFAIEHSTWWDKPAFPIFVYNALNFLAGTDPATRTATRAGDLLRLAVPSEVRNLRVIAPDGSEARINVDAEGTATYAGANRVGLYRLIGESRGKTFEEVHAVNLEDRVESDIRPRRAVELADPQVVPGQVVRREKPELWRWFAGAALIILMLEWYVYTRRVRV